jgi:hypothetical protein
MQYISPRQDLARVDERFMALPMPIQIRVADLMLTIASVPMTLAIDAVLAATEEGNDPRNNRTDHLPPAG